MYLESILNYMLYRNSNINSNLSWVNHKGKSKEKLPEKKKQSEKLDFKENLGDK